MLNSSSAANAPSVLRTDALPASFWPSVRSTQWPLTPLLLTPPHSSSHLKITAGAGLNVLEAAGIDRVSEVYEDDEFTEVGLIRSTHGVRGELKVISRTDFPEQRFEKPGIRWVGFSHMGKFVGIRELKLLTGRKIVQGKEPAWLLTFQGFDTLEKAKELLGATILVKIADRPPLSADQFYIPELIGMSVQLKDSGEVIGSIVDVYNSGASDILRVKLCPWSDEREKESKDSLIWIPFVEEIVPVVDKHARFVQIVPPQGLLELNRPSQRPLKQDLRKQALKTKRKLQERISGVKKRVNALKQEHILMGLTRGEEFQREALKAQLLGIDFRSFKRAMETLSKDPKVSSDPDVYSSPLGTVPSLDWKGLEEWLGSSPKGLEHPKTVNKLTWRLWRRGLELIAHGRVAIVALASGEHMEDTSNASLISHLEHQARQLLALQELAKQAMSAEPVIPWVVVIVGPAREYTENLLKEREYFGLTEGQV